MITGKTGSGVPLADLPYAPPRASASAPKEPPATRTAGLLLLASTSIAVLTWALLFPWGWTPHSVALAQAAVQVVLGLGLLRFGGSFIAGVFTLFALSALYLILRNLPFVVPSRGAVLIGPVVFTAMKALPFALLLMGNPTRGRRKLAWAAFAGAELMSMGTQVLSVWVGYTFLPR